MQIIFFDLDDTIISTKKTNLKIFEKVRAKLGIEADKDEFRKKLRTILRTHMLNIGYFNENESIGIDPIDYYFFKAEYPFGDIDSFKEKVFLDLKKEYDKKFSSKDLENALYDCKMDYTETIEGMKKLLAKLKRTHQTGLITNGISQVQRNKIKAAKLEALFDHVFISGDYGFGKPDPKFYSLIIEITKANPSKSVMIGDNIQADYFGSKAAGMKSIYFSNKEVPYEVTKAKTADELSNLLNELIL
ncbi:MAG: HAD family hydrolase [Tissierellia bacterium]|nr:HAD family hydrolase [Tissierellia bacterium]